MVHTYSKCLSRLQSIHTRHQTNVLSFVIGIIPQDLCEKFKQDIYVKIYMFCYIFHFYPCKGFKLIFSSEKVSKASLLFIFLVSLMDNLT